jgi:hypothetical protein
MDMTAVRVVTGLYDLDSAQVRSAPRWMRRLWVGPVGAITLWSRIYVARELLEGEPRRLQELLVHELVHVRQWRTAGPWRFLRHYLTDYVGGRLARRSHVDAYHGIRYEVEARAIAGRIR